jgi:endoglucanase Acf2
MKPISSSTSYLISSIFIFLFSFSISAQIAVGNGSYTNVFPGTDQAGRNAFPSGAPQLSGDALNKPVPTNDWWSKLIKEDQADNLFNYPMTLKTKNDGLIVTYIPWGPIGDSSPIEVGLTDLNATQTTVSDYSDWTVTMHWDDGSHDLKATSGIGMPFIYFEKGSNDEVEIKINSGSVTVSNEMITIQDAASGADFVVYAPSGSTWNQSGTTYTSSLNGKNYWSVAMLPLSTSSVSNVANEYKKYAYVFPTNTTTVWNYDQNTAKVTTSFTLTTDVKEGTESNVLLGLLPHHWNNLASGSPTPNEYSYETVRGEMRTLDGNSFTVENTFRGILPTLPNLTHYSAGYDPVLLDSKIALIENDALASWTDSYNEGQVMNRLVQTARIADQTGDVEGRDKMVATIKERLEDWLTYQSGEVAFLFYYNQDWSAMLGYPAGHGQDNNINDHHFHWGYFIHAAAFMEQFEPGWVNQWGDMINILIRDAASDDRNDPLFPFLRNFSPYAGHSWANGFATFPHGNDQESTSESMQFASSLIHWGSITGNNAIRDLGIYIYTTEQTAIEEYWFDMYERNFEPSHPYSLVSRVWGNSYDNGTFFTSDIAASYGIELYPIHGGSLYLAHNQSYAASLWTEMTANTGILSNAENPHLWHDTYWKFLSMTDAQSAIDLYDSYPDRNLKFGISDAQTYHWLHSMNAMGTLDASITSNHPISAAFVDNGTLTYVAHNYSNSPITVTFSDGFMLAVPANSMATSRDINVSAELSSDLYQTVENGTVNLSAVTNGTGITKVEFYNEDTLLGEDTTAPYEFEATNLPLGLHGMYAKVFVNTDFVLSNVVTIQVGSQMPYLDTTHTIPGTIEAAHYDYFQGGNGQNISYFDSSIVNEGDFRTDEYVDAVSHNNEGATVGWITNGEWLEYTVDVQTAGCYDLNIRYASGNNNGGGPFYFEVDGMPVSSNIVVASTGDWDAWNTKSTTIDLEAGTQVLRLVATGGEFNIGGMTFSYSGVECSEPTGISLPLDFETSPVTADFNNFDGGTATVEPLMAPQSIGNNSTNSAKIVRDGGQPWAGSFLNLNAPLDFSTNGYIGLNVWTDAPIGTSMQIKLERQSGSGEFFLATPTTVSGEWETLYWDFSSQGVTTFDKLVFMFDIGNVGDGTATSTFYFDDVIQTATLSIEDSISKDAVRIYPNPVTDVLQIESESVDVTKVEVYSILGQKLMERTRELHSINLGELLNGIYLVKLYSGEQHITKRVIKK